MITRSLAAFLAAVLVLGAPLEAAAQNETHTFNQEGKHNKRDDEKAKTMASTITGWAELSAEEQQAILTYIAIDIHGRRRKAVQAFSQEKTGSNLDSDGDNFQIGKKEKNNKPLVIGGYEVVYSEQDKLPVDDKTDSWSKTVPIKPLNFKDVFKDNSWHLKDEAAVRSSIAESFAAFDALKKEHPKASARIGSVHITASASTVFNNAFKTPGDKATRMTHRELSRARANEIHRIVRAELAARGVLTDKAGGPAANDFSYDDEDETPEQSAAKQRQIFTISKGTNGNGTSGPDSPYNCPIWLVPGAIDGNGVAAKDATTLAAVKDFTDKFCPKGDGPASAQAKEWARLEGQANAKQDHAAAASYAKLIENEYEPNRYVAVEFSGSATVSGTSIEKGTPGSAHIILVDISYETKQGRTRGWKTVPVVNHHKHEWLHGVLCKLHLRDKRKCPIPCRQP